MKNNNDTQVLDEGQKLYIEKSKLIDKINTISLKNLASPPSAKIGDKVMYMIQITVPKGTIASNIRVQDTFPYKMQEFITNSVLLDGQSVFSMSVPINGVLTFPIIESIDATNMEITKIYSFDVRIKNGRLTDTFIDKQQNTSQVLWDNDVTGEKDILITNTNTVDIRLAIVRINKTQNNITKNTGDRTWDIEFSGEDILNYKINVVNVGKEVAYDIIIQDMISNKYNIDIDSLRGTKGKGEFIGNELNWKIDYMDQGESVLVSFNVTGGDSLPITDTIENEAEVTFNSNDNTFGKVEGPIPSGIIDAKLNNLEINVVPSKQVAQLGEKIQYTINFKLGRGSVLDDVQVYDLLPTSQEFVVGSATKQVNSSEPEPVVPNITSTVDGQKITFPKPIVGVNNGIDASKSLVNVKYIFSVNIKSGSTPPIYMETQVNKAGVNWSSGAITKETISSTTIMVETSIMNINIEQKNFTILGETGEYTTEDVVSSIGDIMYYKITIYLKGMAEAYNVQIQDILNNAITFLNTIKEPTIGIVEEPNGPSGGNVEWNINTMAPETWATYEFSAKVNDSALLRSFVKNRTNISYAFDTSNNTMYNLSSNTLNTIINGLVLNAIGPKTANIGQEFRYNVNITIPKGKTIYDLKLRIHLDPGQKYIGNTWISSLGIPGITNVSVQSTNIEYVERENPIVATNTSNLVINYTFLVRVTSANDLDPYIETQETAFNLRWSNSAGGTRVFPVINKVDILIGRPVLELHKSQRNKTKGDGPFNVIPLQRVNLGDEIEYSLTLRNIGKSEANNIVIKDTIPAALTFEPTKSTQGIVASGQNLTFNVGSLEPINITTVLINTTANTTVTAPQNGINEFTAEYSGDADGKVTLPEATSSQVGFYYVNPILKNRIVDSQSRDANPVAFSGDIVSYQVGVTIPKGSIAYNVQPAYTLDSHDEYIPGSLQNVVGVPLPPGAPNLVFPNQGTIDATSETKYVVYSFKVRIGAVVGSNQEVRTNIATLNWDSTSSGQKGPTLTKTLNISVTSLKLNIIKTQSNNAVDFVSTPISIGLREKIYFKLEVTNPTSEPIYNININDTLPKGFNIQYIYNIEMTSEFIVDSDILLEQYIFEGTIPMLGIGETASIIYVAKLIGPSTPGDISVSSASINYSLDVDALTTIYGPINSNKLSTKVSERGLEFDKYTSTIKGNLGTVIEYKLIAKIPRGMTIYDIEISDMLPSGEDYLGDATLNGNPINVTQTGNSLTFPTIDEINDTSNMTILTYVYNVRINRVMNTQPFKEIMKNNAEFKWRASPGSLIVSMLYASTEVEVKSPYIRINKYQRNKTDNGLFQISELNVSTGDVVEFKLVIENTALGSAYNVISKDKLNDYIEFKSIVSTTNGNLTYNSNAREVIWSIDELLGEEIATAIFEVSIIGGTVSFGTSTNTYSTTYHSNNTGTPVIIGPINTFAIEQRYPNIDIELSSDKSTSIVDGIVKYNISVIVPNGIKFYNLQVQDILPVGETFINSSLNGSTINPMIHGQLIRFPIINYGEGKINSTLLAIENNDKLNKSLIFNYEINAKIKVANISNANIDIQSNSASIMWSLEPDNTKIIGPISDVVSIKVASNLVNIEKLQRKKGESNFSKEDIEANNDEEIEFKLIISNLEKNKAYNIEIQDTINNNLRFIKVISVTQGTVDVQLTGNNNVMVWSGIDELDVNEELELTYLVKVVTNNMEKISNSAIPKYSIINGGDILIGVPSNEVFIDLKGKKYSFVPSENNYISNNMALGYGIISCKGMIRYLLTNNPSANNSYNLYIDAVPINYKLFINNNFIQEVKKGHIYDEIPESLMKVKPNSINVIQILYYIPKEYNESNNEINFNVSVNLVKDNEITVIEGKIKLGKINLDVSYDVNEYDINPKLFTINYEINIEVSKGIKVYDLELKGLYPPSCIFEKAFKDNIEINTLSLTGEVIYPSIDVIDATLQDIKIQYNYHVLQYKKTPLSVGELEQNKAILSIRASRNIEDKCIFEGSTLNSLGGEEIECVYFNKVFGECTQYYCYRDIQVPYITDYNYKNIIFDNPTIIDGSLNIVEDECGDNFSKVKYEFTISYTIIYEGCGCLQNGECSESIIKNMEGVLERKSLEIDLYIPKSEYDIISHSIVKNIVINENKTKATICLAVITSSIARQSILVNDLGNCKFRYCCPSCSNNFRKKLE